MLTLCLHACAFDTCISSIVTMARNDMPRRVIIVILSADQMISTITAYDK